MSRRLRTAGYLALAAVIALGLQGLISPSTALAKGKPQPPPCDCPETIETPFGTCELVSCGSDCVYVCPFP